MEGRRRLPLCPDFLLVELHNIIWKKIFRGLMQPTDPCQPKLPFRIGLKLDIDPVIADQRISPRNSTSDFDL